MHSSLLFGLAAGTLLSEDLTAISAGLLARDGAIDLVAATAASAAGIYVGDLGLWCLGRVCGRRVLQWDWVRRRTGSTMLTHLGTRLDTHLGLAVLGSRFLPGTRLPMYLALGATGRRPWAFAGWSLLAVMLWTPALVGLTYVFGSSPVAWLVGEVHAAVRHLLTAIVLFATWRVAIRMAARGLASRTSIDLGFGN
jgi:membrane protein DedA with SNARE-associated domain